MKKRIITALIMAVTVFGIVFFAPILFTPMIAVVLAISIWEWCRITKIGKIGNYLVAIATILLWVLTTNFANFLSVILAFSGLHYIYAIYLIIKYEKIEGYQINKLYLCLAGPVILSGLAATLIYILNYSIGSLLFEEAMSLVFIIMVIASADIGAYFTGNFFGKHKLLPRVSPKKTIEGLLGGIIAVIIFAYLFEFMVVGWSLSTLQLIFISIIAALSSVVGDLFISTIKRQNNIKDCSQILPGHGGILDRIDGQLAGIPIFYILQQFL